MNHLPAVNISNHYTAIGQTRGRLKPVITGGTQILKPVSHRFAVALSDGWDRLNTFTLFL